MGILEIIGAISGILGIGAVAIGIYKYTKKRSRRQALEDLGHDPDDADPPDKHDLNVVERHLSEDHSDLKNDIKSLRNDILSLAEKSSPKTISSGEQLAQIEPEPKIKEEAQSLLARLDKLKKSGEDLPLSLELDEGMALVSGGEYDKGIEKIDDYLGKLDNAVAMIQAKANEERFLALKTKGDAYYNRLEYEKGLYSYESALQIKTDSAYTLNEAGACAQNLAIFDKAISFFKQAAEVESQTAGDKTADFATYINNIGVALDDKGDIDGALENYHKALKILKEIHGDNHPHVAAALNNIGATLKAKGDYTGALKNFRKGLKIDLELFGENHRKIATRYNNIGAALDGKGDNDGALENYRKALQIFNGIHGEIRPSVAACFNNIGSSLQTKGDNDGALENYNKALKILKEIHGDNHPYVAATLNNIAHLCNTIGKPAEGLSYIIRAFKIQYRFLGPNHPATKNSRLGIKMHGGDPDAVELEVREEMEKE